MKKKMITSLLFAFPLIFLSAQDPSVNGGSQGSNAGNAKADSVQKVKVEKEKAKGKKENHRDYRDTFNERNKNKGGEAKDQMPGTAENPKDREVKATPVAGGDVVTKEDKKAKEKKAKKEKKVKAKKEKSKEQTDGVSAGKFAP